MPNLYIFKSMPANLNKTPHADLFRAGDCIL